MGLSIGRSGLGISVLLQDWWDLSSTSQVRTFDGEIPSPYKLNKISPLRSIPGCNDPHRVSPDLMHIFNIGYGKDLAASGIIMLCRLGEFVGSSIAKQLEHAFHEFQIWCASCKKTSSLKHFDLKTFKMTSLLR